MNIAIFAFAFYCISAFALPMQKQIQRSGASAGCISKYYNKDLGPLEILMMPLGEKLWLRAWLGMHMSNLLHMEGVDLAEVTQTETDRYKRSIPQMPDTENESKTRKNALEYIAPYSYHLTFMPKVEEATFHGILQINITCLHPTNSIVLHADSNMKLDELTIKRLSSVNVSDRDPFHNEHERRAQEHLEISKIVWTEILSNCEIFLQDSLVKSAQYQIDIKYHSPIIKENEGIIFHRYSPDDPEKRSWFLGTNLKHGNVIKIFPCFHTSKYKATFKIKVIHPAGMAAISSSPLLILEQMSEMPGWVRSHFKVTPPMDPSSLSIFILNSFHFDQVSATTDGGIIIQGFIRGFSTPVVQDTIEYMTAAVPFLEQRLGVSFPAPQLNVIFLPNMTHTAVDFWGMILAGTEVTPVGMLVYLLKQWFGHFVTAENINEEYVTTSLAHYYSYFCSLDLQESCEAGRNHMFASQADFVSLLDVKDRMTAQEFRDQKMVLFLRMLNFSLSEQSFQRGIQVFLKYRSYSTFVEEDLWDALDIQAWSDGTLDRTISTKDISVVWLSQDVLPLVTISTDIENKTLRIEQEVFVRHWPYTIRGHKNIMWQIPIPFTTQNNLMDGKPGSLYWLKEKQNVIEEDVDAFGDYFIGNYNNIGMYIVSYDESNWKALSESLLHDGEIQHFAIPAKTRANLLRNAWYLAVSGHLDFKLALNMTLFLKYENDPSVWKTFAEVYFMVAWKLIGTGVEIKYDRFIGDLLIPIYEKAKQNISRNAKEIQALAYYVLCKAGYEPAMVDARLEFDQWLKAHQEINHGVVGGVLRWIEEDWERGLEHVLHLLEERKLPKVRSFLLSQLAGSPHQEKTERLLSVLLTDPNRVFSKAEIMNVLPAVSSCRTFLEFLTSEWEAIKERYASEPNMWQYILEQAATKCKTPDGVERIEEFYKTHQNDLGISGNSLKHDIEIARRKMEVVYYQIPEFEEDHLSQEVDLCKRQMKTLMPYLKKKMLALKMPEIKREVEHKWHRLENVLDFKDHIIQEILEKIDQKNDIGFMIFQERVQSIDEMLGEVSKATMLKGMLKLQVKTFKENNTMLVSSIVKKPSGGLATDYVIRSPIRKSETYKLVQVEGRPKEIIYDTHLTKNFKDIREIAVSSPIYVQSN
ncbi:Uncharacterized protein GBIM_13434, partial [Gryllus bimaculatus]